MSELDRKARICMVSFKQKEDGFDGTTALEDMQHHVITETLDEIKRLKDAAQIAVDALREMDDESNIIFRAYLGETKVDKSFREVRGTSLRVNRAMSALAALGITPKDGK